jgi:hypothetical protein
MAVTYVSTKAGTGTQARLDLHDDTLYCEFDIAAAVGAADDGGGGAGGTAFVINDVVQMVKVQSGTTILGVYLSVDALDSSTGIVTAVGDGSDEDRFLSGLTIGRSAAAGASGAMAHTGHLYQYTANDTIDFKVTTAASGTASVTGKIRLSVRVTPQQ